MNESSPTHGLSTSRGTRIPRSDSAPAAHTSASAPILPAEKSGWPSRNSTDKFPTSSPQPNRPSCVQGSCTGSNACKLDGRCPPDPRGRSSMSPDSPPGEASIGQLVPVEIGNDRIVLDEVTVRGRRLPVVEDLGGRAVAEVAPPGYAGQGVQIVVDKLSRPATQAG